MNSLTTMLALLLLPGSSSVTSFAQAVRARPPTSTARAQSSSWVTSLTRAA